MIKTFRLKDGIKASVKTTMLKNGWCYFGEKNVQELLQKHYIDIKYNIPDLTTEQTLIELYKRVAKDGIKLYKLEFSDYIYDGTNMAELTKQEKE